MAGKSADFTRLAKNEVAVIVDKVFNNMLVLEEPIYTGAIH